MSDEPSDSQTDVHTGPLDDDGDLTERIADNKVAPETDPGHLEVLDADVAERLRMDFAPTITEDERITFVAIVDGDGRLLVPERIRASHTFSPGDQFLVQAKKLDG